MIKHARYLIPALVILGLVVMLSVAGWFMLRPPHLIIQGEVEATQVKVSSKISGHIQTIEIKRGDSVTRGQLLVTIDSPEIRAKLRQAQAAERGAQAQLEKAQSGARTEEVESARVLWLKAKSAADLAEKTYERIRKLHDEGVVPTQKLDEATANREAAKRTAEAAKAGYDMALAGTRTEDKTTATALVSQATGAVSEVQAYLDDTLLAAPINGEVIDIIAEQGELVGPGFPIITIVDLTDIWVTFNLREDLLADIRMGDVFTATIPGLGNQKVALKINVINPLGEFATWTATKTSGDFDLKTFEVRAAPVEHVAGLRPGMSALVDWSEKLQQPSRPE